MPYISLYRKYRSQTFDDVIGQDHVVRTIRNAIKAGRIGQAYLFCGSRGTGKTTVARLVAKALNCEHGPTPDPCGKCEACVTIAEGNAVDVIEMDAASNRGIDDIRAITEGVKYPPMHLRYKVYIIDEAHQVTKEAKDAFLKTLEEPPAHAVFILATTEASKIPITIRSRCQQFDFRRGTVNEIGDRLRYVVSSENATIEDDAVELIARSASGSYRDSLSLLEQVVAYTEGPITAKDVSTVLGLVEEDVLLELGDVLSARDTAAAFAVADRLMREGRDVRELLKSLAHHFRDLLALKVGADSRHRTDERWRGQAEDFSQDRLVRIIDEFSAAEKESKWNDQHRLSLELALLRAMARPKEDYRGQVTGQREEVAVIAKAPAAAPAARPPQAEPVAPAVERVPAPVTPKLEKIIEEPAPVEVAAPESVPAIVPPADAPAGIGAVPSLIDLQRNWGKVLAYLRSQKHGPTAAFLRGGKLIGINGTVLTLGFKGFNPFSAQQLERDAPRVQEAVEAVIGVRLKVVGVAADPAGVEDEPKAKAPEPVQHPLLDDVLSTFGGTVVDDGKDPWGGLDTDG